MTRPARDRQWRTDMKTSTVSVVSLILLLAPSGAAQSEIKLEAFPESENMSTPVSSTTSQLPMFGASTGGGMCKAPVSYLTGGNTGGNTTGAGNAGNAQTPGAPVDPCRNLETRLPELPNIMDHLGWTNGAALMRDWFSRPASDKPKQNTPNIDTI
ncbi:MAG: DUF6402 family protein, partial [Candidatus Accumulibacter sp.]|nr:DUF6402 family protein [Accumulibacter sp.]